MYQKRQASIVSGNAIKTFAKAKNQRAAYVVPADPQRAPSLKQVRTLSLSDLKTSNFPKDQAIKQLSGGAVFNAAQEMTA